MECSWFTESKMKFFLWAFAFLAVIGGIIGLVHVGAIHLSLWLDGHPEALERFWEEQVASMIDEPFSIEEMVEIHGALEDLRIEYNIACLGEFKFSTQEMDTFAVGDFAYGDPYTPDHDKMLWLHKSKFNAYEFFEKYLNKYPDMAPDKGLDSELWQQLYEEYGPPDSTQLYVSRATLGDLSSCNGDYDNQWCRYAKYWVVDTWNEAPQGEARLMMDGNVNSNTLREVEGMRRPHWSERQYYNQILDFDYVENGRSLIYPRPEISLRDVQIQVAGGEEKLEIYETLKDKWDERPLGEEFLTYEKTKTYGAIFALLLALVFGVPAIFATLGGITLFLLWSFGWYSGSNQPLCIGGEIDIDSQESDYINESSISSTPTSGTVEPHWINGPTPPHHTRLDECQRAIWERDAKELNFYMRRQAGRERAGIDIPNTEYREWNETRTQEFTLPNGEVKEVKWMPPPLSLNDAISKNIDDLMARRNRQPTNKELEAYYGYDPSEFQDSSTAPLEATQVGPNSKPSGAGTGNEIRRRLLKRECRNVHC